MATISAITTKRAKTGLLKDGFFFKTLLFFFGFAKTFSCGTDIYAFIAYPAKGGEVNSLKKG
jgi:hypothetical protein